MLFLIDMRLTAIGSLVGCQESADSNLCGEALWLHGDFFHQTIQVRSRLSVVTRERGIFTLIRK